MRLIIINYAFIKFFAKMILYDIIKLYLCIITNKQKYMIMKKLNFVYVLSLICMIATIFISCEDDKENDENVISDEKIIGLWQFFYSDDAVDGGYVDDGGYLDIKADGTYAFYAQYTLEPPHLWYADEEGSWRVENNEFHMFYTENDGTEDVLSYRIKSVSDTELRLIASFMYEDIDVEEAYRKGNIEDIEFFDETFFVGDWRCVQMTYINYPLGKEETTYRESGEHMEDAFDVSFKNDGTFSVLFFDNDNILESGRYSISDEGNLSWEGMEYEDGNWYISLRSRDKLTIIDRNNWGWELLYYFERESK